jgi:hypothetical protein
MKNENLASITEYAKLCSVSKSVICKRLKKEEILPAEHDKSHKYKMINFVDYPPEGARRGGRPKNGL